MNVQVKSVKVGLVFLLLLLGGGFLLVSNGHDAVTAAMHKKEGILTAEQVKLSFQNVGGRLVQECIVEAQAVKQGDVLMVLDSTDVDLAIARLQTQIKQLEAKISQTSGNINIGYGRTATHEQQAYRQIEQQKMAVDGAAATYRHQQLNYNRKKSLADSGAVSPSELDSAQAALDVAAANVGQQQRMLDKLLSGTDSAERQRVVSQGEASDIYLAEFDLQRQELDNSRFGVEDLVQQRENMLVQLKELLVKKERLTLRAPEDGKVIKIVAKQGEMVAPNAPVILLESKRCYYDIYVDEQQATAFKQGDAITATTVAGGKTVPGTIRLITAAPGFADLKMSREKGQGDLTAFQLRIYINGGQELMPGMTVEVKTDAISKK